MAMPKEHRIAVYKAMEKVLRLAANKQVPITVKDLAQHKEVIGVAKTEQEVKVKVKNLEHARLLVRSKVDPKLGHRGHVGYTWRDTSKTYEDVFQTRTTSAKGRIAKQVRKKVGQTVRLEVFGIVFDLDSVAIKISRESGKVKISID
jgi:hypothetical protein